LNRLGSLLALGLLPLFGLGSFGLVDYDEAAYAEVARAMLATGDWLVPHLCGDVWFEKPPFLYWGAALGMKLLGVGPAGVRLFTALAALVTPLALFGFSRRALGDRAAFAGALVLATSLEFAVLARLALTDMLLILWLVVCLGALHRAFESQKRSLAWMALACAAAGLAVLTKGAIGFLFPGIVAVLELGFRARLREVVRPSWVALAIVLTCGIGFSWYLALGLTQPGGFGFMQSLFLEHHVGRFSEPMQGHGGGPFYYLPVLLVGLFPWSLFLPVAFARAGFRGDGERARLLRLFALASGVTILFFSVAATKLASYVAPALPGIALPIGALLVSDWDPADRLLRWSRRVTLGLVALLAAGCAALPVAVANLPRFLGEKAARHPALVNALDVGPGGALAAAALLLAGASAWWAWRSARGERALVSLACGALAFYTILSHAVLPRLDAHVGAPLRRIAARAAELTPPEQRVLMLGLRHRPSVCFYGERETRFTSESGGKWAEAEVFRGPLHGPIGITGEKQLRRFPHSHRLEILERDGGYVLFRIPEPGAAEGR